MLIFLYWYNVNLVAIMKILWRCDYIYLFLWRCVIHFISATALNRTLKINEDISEGYSENLKAISRFILLKHVMLDFKLELHDIHNLDAAAMFY